VPASGCNSPPGEHRGAEPPSHEIDDSPITDPLSKHREQQVMVERVEEPADVGVHHPPVAPSRMRSRAWWAERFGRNPNDTGEKSASKMGSRTSLTAA
jgi:hypothetical protein